MSSSPHHLPHLQHVMNCTECFEIVLAESRYRYTKFLDSQPEDPPYEPDVSFVDRDSDPDRCTCSTNFSIPICGQPKCMYR